MQSISSLVAETGVLPTSYSLTNSLFSNESFLSRLNLFTFGLFAGLGSSAYHTLALAKTPAIALKFATRITIFNLPVIGSKLDQKLPSLPRGFEYSAPFIHTLKIVAYVFSAIFTPILGFIAPGIALKLHQQLHLVSTKKASKLAVEPDIRVQHQLAGSCVSVNSNNPPHQEVKIAAHPPVSEHPVIPPVDEVALQKTVEASCKRWGSKPRPPFGKLSAAEVSRRQSKASATVAKTKTISDLDKENLVR